MIADSLNYIKGYRYELYCIARAQRVKNCCIYIDYNDTSKCDAWNIQRQSEEVDTYSTDV